nr:MAG TPA: hypothetical protein [Bacteriophage sp.]
MTVTDIIALCNAGYNHEQIMQLAQAQQMERAQPSQQMQPAQQMQQMQPLQPAQQMQPAQPSGYEQIMQELLGLKNAVQAGNMMAAQQPAQPMTADDIIANIIAPKPRKED